jgi:hypothetical protein
LYAAEHVVENSDRMPYAPEFTSDEVQAALQAIVSKEWTALRIEEALNSVVGYFVLESEDFTITVPIDDRLDTLGEEMVTLLDRDETYHYIVHEIVEPIVSQKLEPEVDLAFNVSLTYQEVIDGIEESLPQDWFQQRLTEVIGSIISYTRGESANTDIIVDVEDRKPVILETLTELAEEKVEAAFEALPLCSSEDFSTAIDDAQEGTLPSCRPYEVDYEEFKTILEIDLTEQVESEVMVVIPDQWTYTQSDLIESMGEENEGFLDEARRHVSYGWTFVEADLLNKLDDPEAQDKLEDIRDWLGNGITLTQTDFEDEMDEEEIEDFDSMRNHIDSFLDWLWIFWLFPVVLLIGIGYLGGRNWMQRSCWALSVMILASLITLVGTMLIYSNAIEPEVEEAIDLAEYTGFDRVMAEKMNQILANSADDFASGIQNDALVMLILSAVVLIAIVGWTVYRRRAEKRLVEQNYQFGEQL